MKRILFAVWAGLICCSIRCPAQSSPDTSALPAGPWVLIDAPDFAHWTIDYRYADSATRTKTRVDMAQKIKESASMDPAYARMVSASPSTLLAMVPPQLQQVTIIKTRNLKQQKMVYEGGLTGERWSDGATEATLSPGAKNVTVNYGANDPNTRDFQEFSWIQRNNFLSHKQQGGRDYLIFQQTMPALKVTDPQMYSNLQSADPSNERVKVEVPVTAVIDAATKLPVSLQLGDEVHTYTFLPADTAMLVMPEAFAQAAKQAAAVQRSISRPHPHP